MSVEPNVIGAFALLFPLRVTPVNTLHKYTECFPTKCTIFPYPGSEYPGDVVRRFIFHISEQSIHGAYMFVAHLFL